jgi:hypothetical protein
MLTGEKSKNMVTVPSVSMHIIGAKNELKEWPRWESNPHGGYPPTDFKSQEQNPQLAHGASYHWEFCLSI